MQYPAVSFDLNFFRQCLNIVHNILMLFFSMASVIKILVTNIVDIHLIIS